MSLMPQMGALSWEELSQISRCAFHSFPLFWETGFQRLAGSVRPGVSKSFWMPVPYQTAIKCYFPRLDRFIHCILRTLHPGEAFKIAISSKFRRLGFGSVLSPGCRADAFRWCCSRVRLRSWSRMQLKEHFLWLLICWMPSLRRRGDFSCRDQQRALAEVRLSGLWREMVMQSTWHFLIIDLMQTPGLCLQDIEKGCN